MGQKFKNETDSIDRIAQRVMLALDDSDNPKTLAQIMRETGEQRQSAWYRLVDRDPSLVDHGLVARDDEDPPTYYLTIEGQFWVDSNRDRLELPASFEEVSQTVHEAKKEAESAKRSVQSYRQKVSRTKETAERAKEHTEQIREDAVTEDEFQRRTMELQNELLESINARVQQIAMDIGDTDKLEHQNIVDELRAIHNTVRYHCKYIDKTWNSAKTMTTQNEARIEDLDERLEETDAKITRVEEDLEDEDDAGWFKLRQ